MINLGPDPWLIIGVFVLECVLGVVGYIRATRIHGGSVL